MNKTKDILLYMKEITQKDLDLKKYFDHNTLESLPIAINCCDMNGIIVYCNKAMIDLCGHKPEINKEHWTSLYQFISQSGRKLNKNETPIGKTITGLIAQNNSRYKIVTQNENEKIIISKTEILYDKLNKPTQIIEYINDITEINTSEDPENNDISNIINNQDILYRMIAEIQDYAIFLLDKDGNILNWNKGAEKIKGYRNNEIIGKNFRIFYSQEDQKSELPEQTINEAIKNGRGSFEGWRMRKDGSKFWGNIVITAIHDDQDEIIGFSKITRDLTQKKEIDDQLQDYSKSIELQNKQLEEFAFIASHDLQEPFRKIQLFASILEKNIDDKNIVQKNIQKINYSAQRMSNLIKDILKYSLLSDSEHIKSKINLNYILNDVKENIEILVKEKDAKIIVADLPTIYGIPIQLHQLFYNLINNALKFNNKNPVIKISSVILNKKDSQQLSFLNPEIDYIKIDIEDNGIGFDEKYAEKIFQLFQRLGDKTSGSGIGLALCKKIVDNHKGHIEVSSQIDTGTIFSVFLPINKT